MRELPIVQGLLVCEAVVTDTRTRRRTFVNRFTSLRLARFPSPPVTLSVVVSLTNGFGDFPITLTAVRLESDDEVLRTQTVEYFADRLRPVLLIRRVPELIFPKPGTYGFTLFADDEPLASCLLRVSLRGKGGDRE